MREISLLARHTCLFFLLYFAYTSPFPRAQCKMVKLHKTEGEWYDSFFSVSFFSVPTTAPSFLFSDIARDFSIQPFVASDVESCLQVCYLIVLFSIGCYPSSPSPFVSPIDSRRHFSHRLKKQGSQTYFLMLRRIKHSKYINTFIMQLMILFDYLSFTH